jgi:FHA domain-containing protein
MFQTWRVRLKEARVACQNGRYDEASRFLADEKLRDFLPAKQLAAEVAGKILQRAGDRFAAGDSVAAWHDLSAANRLGGQDELIHQLRQTYEDRSLREVRQCLAVGQPGHAIKCLEKLQKRGIGDDRIRSLQQIAALMQEANQRAAHGHFSEAATAINRAESLAKLPHGEPAIMDQVADRLHAEFDRLRSATSECQRLTTEMHTALATENWSVVLTNADALLALAPQHVAAGQARRRAWKAVGMDVTQLHVRQPPRGPVSLAFNPVNDRRGRSSTHSASRSSKVDTVVGKEQPNRALLWVDAVGGFLVCLDDAITIGQPSPGDPIALPILADLSRRHAVIRREAGAYILEPMQRTLVDGREIKTSFVLSDNQRIQLGDNVRLRFHKPHALSATARLSLESHHKTQPTADAVLLMADSCVLGPNRHCHVQCRSWTRDVIVYRQNNQVFCRADEPLSIDGVLSSGKSELQSGARVEGDDFSFAWEGLT